MQDSAPAGRTSGTALGPRVLKDPAEVSWGPQGSSPGRAVKGRKASIEKPFADRPPRWVWTGQVSRTQDLQLRAGGVHVPPTRRPLARGSHTTRPVFLTFSFLLLSNLQPRGVLRIKNSSRKSAHANKKWHQRTQVSSPQWDGRREDSVRAAGTGACRARSREGARHPPTAPRALPSLRGLSTAPRGAGFGSPPQATVSLPKGPPFGPCQCPPGAAFEDHPLPVTWRTLGEQCRCRGHSWSHSGPWTVEIRVWLPQWCYRQDTCSLRGRQDGQRQLLRVSAKRLPTQRRSACVSTTRHSHVQCPV